MPLQNRVDPFGLIQAHPARGGIMGNRGGRIHTDARTLATRRWASKQWICCQLEFKDRQREVMGAGYTELFFLDEATALAAGHRPCFECRRAAADRFAEIWAEAGLGPKSVPGQARSKASARQRSMAGEIDAVLHRERLAKRRKRVRLVALDGLPPGAMIARDEGAWLVTEEGFWPWSFTGYGQLIPRDRWGAEAKGFLLTPPSTVRCLALGYRPQMAMTALSAPEAGSVQAGSVQAAPRSSVAPSLRPRRPAVA